MCGTGCYNSKFVSSALLMSNLHLESLCHYLSYVFFLLLRLLCIVVFLYFFAPRYGKGAFIATTSYFVAQGWLEALPLRRLWGYVFNIQPRVIDDSEKILQNRAEARAQMEENRRCIENEARRSYSISKAVDTRRGSLSGSNSPLPSIQQTGKFEVIS